ncbi:hypothetical protein C8Q78DRAFT_207699 [Trametes maxima]|nr:hypothetical protein C8Q78DRAFT_207699 [Trametes maxima]
MAIGSDRGAPSRISLGTLLTRYTIHAVACKLAFAAWHARGRSRPASISRQGDRSGQVRSAHDRTGSPTSPKARRLARRLEVGAAAAAAAPTPREQTRLSSCGRSTSGTGPVLSDRRSRDRHNGRDDSASANQSMWFASRPRVTPAPAPRCAGLPTQIPGPHRLELGLRSPKPRRTASERTRRTSASPELKLEARTRKLASPDARRARDASRW